MLIQPMAALSTLLIFTQVADVHQDQNTLYSNVTNKILAEKHVQVKK